jgi:hypothetical protein
MPREAEPSPGFKFAVNPETPIFMLPAPLRMVTPLETVGGARTGARSPLRPHLTRQTDAPLGARRQRLALSLTATLKPRQPLYSLPAFSLGPETHRLADSGCPDLAVRSEEPGRPRFLMISPKSPRRLAPRRLAAIPSLSPLSQNR